MYLLINEYYFMFLDDKFSEDERVKILKLSLEYKENIESLEKYINGKIPTNYISFNDTYKNKSLYNKFIGLYIEEKINISEEKIIELDNIIKKGKIDLLEGFSNNPLLILDNVIDEIINKIMKSSVIDENNIRNLLEITEYRNQISQLEFEYLESRYRDFLISNINKQNEK